MAEHIIVTASDWSDIQKKNIQADSDDVKNDVLNQLKEYASRSDDVNNMGLHIYNDKLSTAGFIGAKSFRYHDQKDIVLYISPRFSVDPYIMLNSVLEDEEYEKYELDRKDKAPLYTVFDRESLIPSSGSDFGGELLLAVSYIKSCEWVCKKVLRSRMTFYEENLNGRIKGKILFSKQIKHNISVGREDRVFCRYQTFSIDTPENRILKAALFKAARIIDRSAADSRRKLPSIRKSIRYCMKMLSNVKQIDLSKNKFTNLKINGLYSYYQKPIQLAKLICDKGRLSASYGEKHEYKIIPYAINMESLFEYYVRTRLRKQEFYLEEYNKKFMYLKTQKNCGHLIENYIPDIVLYERTNEGDKGKCLGVFDVKYKDHSFRDRNDSHQLMSYVLMFDTGLCGFIMPLKADEAVKPLSEADLDGADSVLTDAGIAAAGQAMINTQRNLDIRYIEYLVWTETQQTTE